MFASIPFPSGQSRTSSVDGSSTFPSTKMPASSFFGQPTFGGGGGPTPDLLIPPRNPPSLAGSVAKSLPDDCLEPFDTDDLNRRKLKLTVETLEKQSHLLSLQIWHYECQYGLPHSEFSRRFDIGGASSDPIPDHERAQDEMAEKDAGIDPGEGPSGVEAQPAAEVSDAVLKKEDSMEDSDDTEEEGLCTDDPTEDPEKPTEEPFATTKPAEAAPDTSFTNLFGQPSASINFGSIFGGIAQTKPPQPKPSINFSLPQVSQATKMDPETAKLSHRKLELDVETLQKQSHLLSLQILHYENRHRIPHSEFSSMLAAVEDNVEQNVTQEGVTADPEPIDYTMVTIGSE